MSELQSRARPARLARLARLTIAGTALVAACARGTDHERIGDRRYAEQAWVDALAEYRLAARQHNPSLELRAKIGAAALKAGALAEAAVAYRDLGDADESARDEAAEGLMRTARAAVQVRDVAALRAAVTALEKLAPTRLPELGGALGLVVQDRRADADLDLVLTAAAAAGGASADSLVAMWAEASAHAGQCEVAAPAFGALIARAATNALVRLARGGLSGCRVDAGRAALSAGNLEDAEAAFRAAVAIGVPDSTVRLAWVLIGDVRWADGDTVLAIEAYRKAMTGAEDDNPIAQRARDQLQRLTGGTTPP